MESGEGGAVQLGPGQGAGGRPGAGGQGRRGGGHGAHGAGGHKGTAPAHGHLRARPAQVHPRVPCARTPPEMFCRPKRGEDTTHQGDRHWARLPDLSSPSGGVDRVGRVRPDFPGGESAQSQREAWREGEVDDHPKHGAPATSGGFQTLQPNPSQLLDGSDTRHHFGEIAHDMRVIASPKYCSGYV